LSTDLVENFIRDCQKCGLNVTYQRLAVFKVLAHHRGHPSAEEIYREVLKEYPRISLATIYTTLETLTRHGIIAKVTPLHDTARYDQNRELHHHLVCIKCRKINDIEDENFSNFVLADDLRMDFKILNYKIQFEGVCPDCQSLADNH